MPILFLRLRLRAVALLLAGCLPAIAAPAAPAVERLPSALVVGPTRRAGEFAVVLEGSAAAARRGERGALRADAGDDPDVWRVSRGRGQPRWRLDVGDRLERAVGLIERRHGRPRLTLTEPPVVHRGGLRREVTPLAPAPGRLTVATFNVQNLHAGDSAERLARLARQIVVNLRAPDIVALQEVQDDDGPADRGHVGAAATLARLLDAVRAAGGPAYRWRQVDPADGADGGAPGGNIRPVLLADPRRVAFVDRPAREASPAAGVVRDGDGGAALAASPARLAPGDRAFAASRKPLAVELQVEGRRLVVVANHFASRRRDAADEAGTAPGGVQRLAQARVVAGFVGALLAVDAQAAVVVLGDLNDGEASAPLAALRAAPLFNPMERLPAAERYTFIHDGNAQPLDHVLLSPSLAAAQPELDIVHVNAEFADAASDHDPVVVRLAWPPPLMPAPARR